MYIRYSLRASLSLLNGFKSDDTDTRDCFFVEMIFTVKGTIIKTRGIF